jgi:hypothetical protein
MKKGITIAGIAALGVGLVARIALAMEKSSIIVNTSAASFRLFVWAARGLLLFGTAVVAAVVLRLVLARSEARQMEKRMDALRTADRKSKAPLSTESGRFNEEKMRELLQSLFTTAPAQLAAYRPRFQVQLDRMNEYQANLKRLLRNNDATELSEAEAFLDKLEQNMFGKMRQVYNLLMMYDETAPIEELQTSLDDALTHNDRVLDQARKLNATVTEYINNQGGTQESLGSVEAFIKVLQEELT